MGISCNGCRVLRKGCSDKCTIRPCLEWIKNPQSQANATLFLAKFYGRAGLINLVNAGPQNLRPAIFRSLLYEACGRIVNPIYGSVGLHVSGCWHLCQAAVEAVLSGAPITQVSPDSAMNGVRPTSLKACDIRHVSNEKSSAASDQLHKVKSRSRFKRSDSKPKPRAGSGTVSRDSGVSPGPSWGRGDSGEGDSASVETVEASLAKGDEGRNVDLELTLGLGPRLLNVGPVDTNISSSGS